MSFSPSCLKRWCPFLSLSSFAGTVTIIILHAISKTQLFKYKRRGYTLLLLSVPLSTFQNNKNNENSAWYMSGEIMINNSLHFFSSRSNHNHSNDVITINKINVIARYDDGFRFWVCVGRGTRSNNVIWTMDSISRAVTDSIHKTAWAFVCLGIKF